VLADPGGDDVYTRHLLHETATVLAEDDDRFTRFTKG